MLSYLVTFRLSYLRHKSTDKMLNMNVFKKYIQFCLQVQILFTEISVKYLKHLPLFIQPFVCLALALVSFSTPMTTHNSQGNVAITAHLCVFLENVVPLHITPQTWTGCL